MSIDLGRRLIAVGLVLPEDVEAALFLSLVRGVPFARALIDRGVITERGLEEELDRVGGLSLRQVMGSPILFARLPRALCRRLAALPTRVDPATGVVDVAAVDPLDPHIASELGFHLGAPIRVLRASIAAIEDAIRHLELEERKPAEPGRRRRLTPPFPHGAPQSTLPPPEPEESPIPLVRRTAADAPPDAPAEPARRTLLPSYDPQALDHAPRYQPQVPYAISFPSAPPSGDRDRITPAYGTPVLAPPAAPMEVGRRAATEGPDGVVAPPDDDGSEPGPWVSPSDARRAGRPRVPPPVDAAILDPQRRIRAPDGSALLEGLERAASRDEVIRLALRGMRLVARRLALFAVKRDGFHGWACNVELGDADALRELSVPFDQPSVLATAAATALYLGPIPPTAAHAGLLAVMEKSSSDVAVVAARVSGRPALILLVDELEDTLIGTRFLEELAQAVGDALTRLVAARA